MPAGSGDRWWRRQVGRGLVLFVTGVSLYLIFPTLVSVFGSWRSLTHLGWGWAGLALLAESASFVSLWELDRVALRAKSWFVVACAQLSGNAIGRIVPGGGATASAFAVGMLRRANVDTGRAVTALAASTGLQIATTLALPLLALPAIFGGAPVNPSLIASAYLGTAVLVFLLGAGAVAFATDRPLKVVGRGIQWALHRSARGRRADMGRCKLMRLGLEEKPNAGRGPQIRAGSRIGFGGRGFVVSGGTSGFFARGHHDQHGNLRAHP